MHPANPPPERARMQVTRAPRPREDAWPTRRALCTLFVHRLGASTFHITFARHPCAPPLRTTFARRFSKPPVCTILARRLWPPLPTRGYKPCTVPHRTRFTRAPHYLELNASGNDSRGSAPRGSDTDVRPRPQARRQAANTQAAGRRKRRAAGPQTCGGQNAERVTQGLAQGIELRGQQGYHFKQQK